MFVRVLMLAMMGAVIGFEIYAMTQVSKSSLNGKWKWILLCLVGATQAQLVWQTGAFGFQPFYVSFLGFSVMQHGAGPWVISVSFPVGAIMALRKVESELAQAPESPRAVHQMAAEGNDHGV